MAYRYPTIKVDGKTKLKHRHVAEQRLGRQLRPGEEVHHRDEDTFNASPDNLRVMDGEEHRQLHADARLIHPREKLCAVCGAVFTPHPTKRKRARTCSPHCANVLRSRTERETKRPPIAAALVAANCADLAVANREAAE